MEPDLDGWVIFKELLETVRLHDAAGNGHHDELLRRADEFRELHDQHIEPPSEPEGIDAPGEDKGAEQGA